MNATRKSVLLLPLALLLFLSAALIRADSAPVTSSELVALPEPLYYHSLSLDSRSKLKNPVNLLKIPSSEIPLSHYSGEKSVIIQAPSVICSLNNKPSEMNDRCFPDWNSHSLSSETLMGDGAYILPLFSNEPAVPAEENRSDGMGDNGNREALPYRSLSTPSSWQLSEQPPFTLSAYALRMAAPPLTDEITHGWYGWMMGSRGLLADNEQQRTGFRPGFSPGVKVASPAAKIGYAGVTTSKSWRYGHHQLSPMLELLFHYLTIDSARYGVGPGKQSERRISYSGGMRYEFTHDAKKVSGLRFGNEAILVHRAGRSDKRIVAEGCRAISLISDPRGNSFQFKTDAGLPLVGNTELSSQMLYQKRLQKEGIDDCGIAAGITVSF